MSKTIKLKRYKWSSKSILTNSNSCMALSKGLYSKDDCGKLTSKCASNTRHSKQNTYHVVNKNIAPSKLPMEVDERGDAFRGIPKLWLLGVLRLSLGCYGHPQDNPRTPKSQSLGMPRKASPLSSTSIGDLFGAIFLFTNIICVLLGASCIILVLAF